MTVPNAHIGDNQRGFEGLDTYTKAFRDMEFFCYIQDF